MLHTPSKLKIQALKKLSETQILEPFLLDSFTLQEVNSAISLGIINWHLFDCFKSRINWRHVTGFDRAK